jgi:NADH-quinone oxidoreductase subunit G
MPKVTIDGKEVEVPAGTTVLQAARGLGKDVPHYCWHPGLSVAGNCRICLVEVQGMRGTQISCNLPCADGMVVKTESDLAKKARADVMELLLINHPLDCPICDQAGECKLQEYSFELGSGASRFDVPKNHKRKRIEFSDRVVFDAERCIVCTRCVRFTQEVTKNGELTVVQRGDRSEIDVAPGKSMTGNYQMNVIDICPVGALTSADFRFQSRVWFMEQKRTVCGSCSRGCNVQAGTRWNRVLRLVPAENEDVNRWWMCDHGRLDIKDVAAEDRLASGRILRDGKLADATAEEALDAVAGALRDAKSEGGAGLFGLVSARLTTEECWLARRLLRDWAGSPNLDFKPRTGEADGFLLTADRNPNAAGARLAGIAPAAGGFGLDGLKAAAAAGKVKWAILVGEDLDDRPEDLAALSRVPFVAVIGSREGDTARKAVAVVPGATWAEKDGTWVNGGGRMQRIRACVRAPGEARPESRILLDLLARVGAPGVPAADASPAALFRAMAAEVPALEGLTLAKVGTLGVAVQGAGAGLKVPQGVEV